MPGSLATLDGSPLPRRTDVPCCHGCCWTEETSDRFDDDRLIHDDATGKQLCRASADRILTAQRR